MATYRIDVYAGPLPGGQGSPESPTEQGDGCHLVDVHMVTAARGYDAIWAAHVDINRRHADHADVFMGDGTGAALYYATVRNEVGTYGSGDDVVRLYRDDVERMLLNAGAGQVPR